MKKNKIILSIITILTLILSNDVKAYNATGVMGSKNDSRGIYFPNNRGKSYSDRDFAIQFGGKTYTAYCLDPGYNFNSGSVPMNCEPVDGNNRKTAGMVWLINNLSGDHVVDMLAIRMAAVYFDFHQTSRDAGYQILIFMEEMDRALAEEKAEREWRAEGDSLLSSGDSNGAQYLYDRADEARRNAEDARENARSSLNATTSAGEETITRAYNMARQAIDHINDTYDNSANSQIHATITKESSTPTDTYYTAVLNVRVSASNASIDESAIKYECENCEVVNVSRFGEMSAYNPFENYQNAVVTQTVTVRVTSPNCSYKLKVKYDDMLESNKNIAYVCYNNDPQLQHLLAVMPDSLASQTPGADIGEFAETITSNFGGNYFQNFCTNPEELECTQHTAYNKDPFCDDASDQNMNIAAPTDIKACILKEEDEANNSYAMAGFETNKYCSVYCKEDYEMTMPGAKYTTSGRYFETKNVLVKGTKTCYTSSPNSITNDKITNIDIDQFIDDIISQQKDLVNKFNNYLLQKAKRDNKDNVDVSSSADCSGHSDNWYKLKSFHYTVKNISCDEKSGKCTVTDADAVYAGGDGWGTSHSLSYPCTEYGGYKADGSRECLNNTCSDSPTTVSEPDWDQLVENAKSAVVSANDVIKATITTFSKCYNWETDYCFNPEVDFDYQEQYNTSINYQKVGGSVTQNAKVEGNQNKTIDNNYTTSTMEANESYDYLSSNGESIQSNNKATDISTLYTHIYHLKKTADGEAEFNNKQNFQTNYPHGTIDTIAEGATPRENYSYLGAKFPVALKTEFGVYNWVLSFKNIGQYMDRCSYGRLNDVVKKLDNSLDTDIGYVCFYVIDCPDCDSTCSCPDNPKDGYTCYEEVINGEKLCKITNVDCEGDECYPTDDECVGPNCDPGDNDDECVGPDCDPGDNDDECVGPDCNPPDTPCEGPDCDEGCEGPNCHYDPCEGPECEDECVGVGCNFCTDGEYPCIVTTDEKYTYRAISLTDVFPNNRTIGANWRNEKGSKATTEIEKDGENAYINASYSFKLTAENMRNIRMSNAEIGGFVDYNNIKYEDFNGYQNFLAKSKFIREGKNSRNNFFSELKYSDSWTVYSGTINTSGSGPAWK